MTEDLSCGVPAAVRAVHYPDVRYASNRWSHMNVHRAVGGAAAFGDATGGAGPNVHPLLWRADVTGANHLADGSQRVWDQGHGWGDGWVTDGVATAAAAPAAAAPAATSTSAAPASLEMPRPSTVSSGLGYVNRCRGGLPGIAAYNRARTEQQLKQKQQKQDEQQKEDDEEEEGKETCEGFGTPAWGRRRGGGSSYYSGVHRTVGRGRGCGRGGIAECGSAVGGLSEAMSRDDGGGGGSGGGGKFALDGALRLGKRPGYAGRGQGEELRCGGGGEEEKRGDKVDVRLWGEVSGLPVPEGKRGEEMRGGRGEQGPGDGRTMLFTASDDGTAKSWDATTGR